MDARTPDILKRLMAENGINQQELAKKAGVSKPTIGRILRGEVSNPVSLTAIANALEVPIGVLHGETQLATYTLDNAPVCVDSYYIEIPGQDMHLEFIPHDTVLFEVIPWDSESKDVIRALFRITGQKKALVVVVSEVGDDLHLFPAQLISSGRSDIQFSSDDGQILGAISDVVSLSDHFRR